MTLTLETLLPRLTCILQATLKIPFATKTLFVSTEESLRGKQKFYSMILAGAFGLAMLTGCAEHHYYRAYDPYHNDYHAWDNHETVYYQQWAVQTHHDPHHDYRKLNHDEQKQYWDWRHQHENDHR